MSQENVEIVKTAIDAFNCRDTPTLADLSCQDLEIVSVLATMDASEATVQGSEAWAGYFAAMDETWGEWQVEAPDVFDGGDDSVVCLCRVVGKGKRSGVSVERAVGITYQIQQARLWRVSSYPDPDEALKAVGLAE